MQKTGFRWEDVTVDNITVKPYDSKPYNPDIARVFYRAGFIESWGLGIQKICDECQNIGAELPAYELTGTTLRIRFQALESALIDQPKVQKGQSARDDGTINDTMAFGIIDEIRRKPEITLDQLSEQVGISRRTLVRYMNVLKKEKRIECVGGRRYGHWQINE